MDGMGVWVNSLIAIFLCGCASGGTRWHLLYANRSLAFLADTIATVQTLA